MFEIIEDHINDMKVGEGFDTPRKILNKSSKELSKETGISVEMAEDLMEQLRKIRT